MCLVGANTNFCSIFNCRLAADKQTEASLQTPDLSRLAGGEEFQTNTRNNLRNLQRASEGESACDAAFLDCLQSDTCVNCFVELETKQIDWASVTSETPCQDVTKFLFAANHCSSMKNDSVGQGTFCKTFDTCVDWSDDGDKKKDDPNRVKCSELTECKWDGMHEQFLGDGICHDKVEGCYNTAICGYDGGDCCPDTCHTPEGSYVECGHEDYACKDPNSSKCDKLLNPVCKSSDDNKPKPAPTCKDGTTIYRMIMYDSFGDGWDGTKLEISDKKSVNNILYGLQLSEGSQGTEYICLSKTPACYHVDVKGGTWGKEVSWEVKPLGDGAPSIGSGGSPMSCDFPVAGDTSCTNTCTGKTDEDPTKDPDYKQFKTMSQCISDKCPIQIGACQEDDVCTDCFRDIPADYCYADDFFNALLDCAICKCTDSTGTDFCEKKQSPGQLPVDTVDDDDYGSWTQDPCSPAETVTGGNAVLAFGKCTSFDQTSMMVTDFDQNNFGMLDRFEACAHAWQSKPDRGGNTALSCLQILVDAKDGAFNDYNTPANAPKEAIKALASNLYNHPEEFCECASKASRNCPLCPSFMNFKTLLYESMDACLSLDEIDCGAWTEFYPKCKENLTRDKGTPDFTKTDHCKYVHDGCGNAGPFPVFRRLDCDKEVSNEAWTFYTSYAKSCMGNAPAPTPPAPTPTPPVPTPTPPAPAPAPSTDDYITPVSPSDKKPYVPPEERGKKKKKSSESGEPKKKSHFFRNMFLLLLVGGGAYYYHKNYGFDFSFLQRYRRFRPVSAYDQGGEMYSGLTMESSTSFQPPTLPPTPIDMGGGSHNNGGHFI
uniref:LNR domain-containing protein n=1 Tax=Amphora coffeiformis TaxID=265554 RepID=A0A7S3PDF9_9STRA